MENQLENQFKQLNVAEGSEPAAKTKKAPIFSMAQLKKTMQKNLDLDDDDDDE